MENRAHALAAGIFTLLLGISLAGAVWWFSGKREATSEYILYTSRNVTGLNPQAQVRYRGILSGKVQKITLDPKDPRLILVRIGIASAIPLTATTTAKINYQGVTGLAYVQIEDGDPSGAPLTALEGELPRIALKPSPLGQATDAAAEMLGQARELLTRLNALLSEQNVKRIDQTLVNLEGASGHLKATLKDAPQVMASLRQVLNETNIKRWQNILERIERASGEAAPLAADMRGLIANLQGLSQRLDSLSNETGAQLTAQTLPRLNQLLSDLAANSRQMTRLMEELESSPQSLIFGKPAPPPGPGEAGFSK